VDPHRVTQLGRALRELGVQMQFERTVGRDNTVSFQHMVLQIDKRGASEIASLC
jgi:hypothetical protein